MVLLLLLLLLVKDAHKIFFFNCFKVTKAFLQRMGMDSYFLFSDHPEVVFEVGRLPPIVYDYFFNASPLDKNAKHLVTAQEIGDLIMKDMGWKILNYLDEEKCYFWSELGKVAQRPVKLHLYFEEGRPFYFINRKTYLYIFDNDDRYMLNIYKIEDKEENNLADHDGQESSSHQVPLSLCTTTTDDQEKMTTTTTTMKKKLVVEIPCELDKSGKYNQADLTDTRFATARYKRDLEDGAIDFKKNLLTNSGCQGEGGHPECLLC